MKGRKFIVSKNCHFLSVAFDVKQVRGESHAEKILLIVWPTVQLSEFVNELLFVDSGSFRKTRMLRLR